MSELNVGSVAGNSQSRPQSPSLRRMVSYQAHGSPNGQHKGAERAAMIVGVHDDTTVDLVVFNPTGIFFNQRCVLGGPEVPGSWYWPPFVPGPGIAPKP